MNDVYATSIFGSRLGRSDGFGCSPVGHAVLDVPLEEGHRIRVRISASLKLYAAGRKSYHPRYSLFAILNRTSPTTDSCRETSDPLGHTWPLR